MEMVALAAEDATTSTSAARCATAAADVELADVDIGDASVIPGLEAHRTPDATGDEARAPIPSVLVGGFAEIGLGLDACLLTPGIVGRDVGSGFDGRREDDAQLVCARLEVRTSR